MAEKGEEFNQFLTLLEEYLSGISHRLGEYVPGDDRRDLREAIDNYIGYIKKDQIERLRRVLTALEGEPEIQRLNKEIQPLNAVVKAYVDLEEGGRQ